MVTRKGMRPLSKALKSRTSEYKSIPIFEYKSNPILKSVPMAPKKRNAPNYKVPSTPKVSGEKWGG